MSNRSPFIRGFTWGGALLLMIVMLIITAKAGFSMDLGAESPVKIDSVLFVKWGKRASELSFRTADVQDPRVVYEVPLAVNSFWVESDETIYFLEVGRVLKTFKEGKYIRSTDIGRFGYVNDFMVYGNRIFAVTLHDLLEFSASGELIRKKRVFGMAGKNSGVEGLLRLENKLVLKRRTDIIREKTHFDPAHVCVDIFSFEQTPCGKFEASLNTRQVLDVDGESYIWNDAVVNELAVASIDRGLSYSTGMDIAQFSDEIEFMHNAIVRIKDKKIYWLSPDGGGLRVLKRTTIGEN